MVQELPTFEADNLDLADQKPFTLVQPPLRRRVLDNGSLCTVAPHLPLALTKVLDNQGRLAGTDCPQERTAEETKAQINQKESTEETQTCNLIHFVPLVHM